MYETGSRIGIGKDRMMVRKHSNGYWVMVHHKEEVQFADTLEAVEVAELKVRDASKKNGLRGYYYQLTGTNQGFVVGLYSDSMMIQVVLTLVGQHLLLAMSHILLPTKIL